MPSSRNVSALWAGARMAVTVLGLWMVAAMPLLADEHEEDIPLIAPEGPVGGGGAGFAFDTKRNKTRRSVSGIACPPEADQPSGERTCLFAFDEGVEARLAVVRHDGLSPLPERIVLRSNGGELDAEGAALDGSFFYVAGSHSAKRNSCASNPGSRHVVRFERDPKTGGVARDPSGGLGGFKDSGSRLWEAMSSLPDLSPFVGEEKCLGTEPPADRPGLKGQRGVNIEGIAVSKGRLALGFRGPTTTGHAFMLEVDTAGLFDDGPLNAQVTRVAVGRGLGIRDIQATEAGLLILAGPDDDVANANAGWLVGLWSGAILDGVGQPNWLAKLKLDGLVRASCDEEIKPEAISLLERTTETLQVLILSDGMCDGGPLRFSLPLPTPKR